MSDELYYFRNLSSHILKDQIDSVTGMKYDAIDVDWVKTFIKLLKQKCTWDNDEVVSHKWVKNVINKLSGDVLCENHAHHTNCPLDVNGSDDAE